MNLWLNYYYFLGVFLFGDKEILLFNLLILFESITKLKSRNYEDDIKKNYIIFNYIQESY